MTLPFRRSSVENTSRSSSIRSHPNHAAPAVEAVKRLGSECLPATALTLLRRKQQEQASDSQLCLLLHPRRDDGALPLELGITEIAGTAGCGKTQIGLGLCVSCAMTRHSTGGQQQTVENRPLSPNYSKSLYVSLGEGTTNARLAQRLQQMATHRGNADDVLTRILTRFIRNDDEFSQFLKGELPELLSQSQHVGIIVLDSIASLFRVSQTTHTNTTYAKRSGVLFQIAAHLKRLSDLYRVPIVIINQVTSSFEAKREVPALGISWANCVNTSYMLSRTEGVRSVTLDTHEDKSQTSFARTISLVRSSSLPKASTSFRIDAAGAVVV